MSVDPSLANGYGYAAWCFAPALVYYQRNLPDAAHIAIQNMGQDALNWLQQRGAPVQQITAIRDPVACNNVAGVIRTFLIQYFRNEFGYAQGPLFDLGLGLGSARTHCMHDGANEGQWPQERYATISALDLAKRSLPACLGQFNSTIIDIQFELNSCAPFANATQDKILNILQAVPQLYIQNGP